MRSFPICDNSHADTTTLPCTHSHCGHLSPSEQRAPWVINQLVSEMQGTEKSRSGFIHSELCGIPALLWLTFPPGPSICLCFGLFLQSVHIPSLSIWDKQILVGRSWTGVFLCVLQRVQVYVMCLTSGKLLMLTIMSWGDFMEIWPSWLRGNFPSWVVTTMWSRAPEQIQISGCDYYFFIYLLEALINYSINGFTTCKFMNISLNICRFELLLS